jgi:hypothetical protein
MDLNFERGDFRGELGVSDRLVVSWLLVLMGDIVGKRLGPLEECGVRSEFWGIFCSEECVLFGFLLVLGEDLFFFVDLIDDRGGFVVLGVFFLFEQGYFFSDLCIFLFIKQY